MDIPCVCGHPKHADGRCDGYVERYTQRTPDRKENRVDGCSCRMYVPDPDLELEAEDAEYRQAHPDEP